MSVTHYLRDDFVGETRWAACAENGRIVSVFTDRKIDNTNAAWHGRILDAVVRAIQPAQGGAFLELSNGDAALMRLKGDMAINQGQRLAVRVVAEAHRDKSARVAPSSPDETGTESPLEAWKSTLKASNVPKLHETASNDHTIDEAFEIALAPSITLPNGGLLRIDPTNALTAADIDTHGRTDKGRAVNRAIAINTEAAEAFAQQAVLRNLGGIMVLDCVAPLTRDTSKTIRDAFSAQISAITRRPCRVLPPSELGLLQASIAWGVQPLSERLCEASGEPTAATILYGALRDLQRNAARTPMKRHMLALPADASALWTKLSEELMPKLEARHGARLSIVRSDRNRVDLQET